MKLFALRLLSKENGLSVRKLCAWLSRPNSKSIVCSKLNRVAYLESVGSEKTCSFAAANVLNSITRALPPKRLVQNCHHMIESSRNIQILDSTPLQPLVDYVTNACPRHFHRRVEAATYCIMEGGNHCQSHWELPVFERRCASGNTHVVTCGVGLRNWRNKATA